MKKRIIITASLISVVFLLSVLFAKQAYASFFLKETAPQLNGREQLIITSLNKGDYIVFGSYKGEKILWKVADISNQKPLLVSEYIVCFKAYSVGNSELKYGSSDFEKSTLKVWLNSSEEKVSYQTGCVPDKKSVNKGYNAYDDESGFLCGDNFSSYEKQLISDNGVFILKRNEFQKLFNEKERMKKCTKTAIINDDSPFLVTENRNVWYWTSSSVSQNKMSVASVTSSGGFYKSLPYDGTSGVVPSLYLNSIEITSLEGDGTKENPYYIFQENI